MNQEVFIAVGIGCMLSVIIIFVNTRTSKANLDQYLAKSQNFEKSNESYTTERISDTSVGDKYSSLSESKLQGSVALNEYDIVRVVEWAVFLVLMFVLAYTINESTDGDFARIIVGIFPNEFQALGLKEYFERLRPSRKHELEPVNEL